MSSCLRLIVLPLALWLVLLPGSAAAQGAAPIEVRGTVTAQETGRPVRNGTVLLRGPGQDALHAPVRTELAADGTYSLRFSPADFGPNPGTLLLTVSAEGFATTEKRFSPPAEGAGSLVSLNVQLPASTLNTILDIFSCCLLNWSVVTVLLPAFFLAGAIKVFIPSRRFMKYLGATASPRAAYTTAVGSGMALSLCSCSIVPLFLSIRRSGAGIGPAFAFLFAGPALSVVSAILTCRVIGLGMGLCRVAAVVLISLLVGLIMASVFREEREPAAAAPPEELRETSDPAPAALIIALLLLTFALSSIGLPAKHHLMAEAPLCLGISATAGFWLDRNRCVLWLRETGLLLWQTLPIFIPAVLAMGYLARKVPLSATRPLVDANGLGVNLAASTFGAFMYFPALTEVAFVKTLLKVFDIGIGPAMALLLTGPGLSLPGMLIIGREIGIRKLLVYVVSVIVLAALAGALFGSSFGRLVCTCKLR
jgi:hypothetical protein